MYQEFSFWLERHQGWLGLGVYLGTNFFFFFIFFFSGCSYTVKVHDFLMRFSLLWATLISLGKRKLGNAGTRKLHI